MPINPSIAMGVNPIRVKQRDPYEEFSKQSQLQALMTSQADDELTRQAMRESGGDTESALKRLISGGGSLKAIAGLQGMADARAKAKSETAYREAQTGKLLSDAEAAGIAKHRDMLSMVRDPQTAAQWIQMGYSDPVIGKRFQSLVPMEQALQSIPQDPAEFQTWVQKQGLGATKFIEMNKPVLSNRNLGNVDELTSTPGMGGAPTVLSSRPILESEAQRLARERQEAQAKATLAQSASQFAAQHGQRQKFHDEKLGADKAAVGKIEWKQDTDGSWVALPKEVKAGTPVVPIRTTLPGKKEVQSGHAIDIINEARGLVDQATGSFVGAGVDFAGRTVGASTGGAIATGKLKALEGSLMMAQPRMEGPQSDKDVALYRQMAGQIGDPTVQREVKKAALDTIENLHRKYAPNAPGAAPKPAGGPKPIKNDADYNALPSGAEFIGPDGKTRRKP